MINTRFIIFFNKKNVILNDYLGTIINTMMLPFTPSTLQVELVIVWCRLIYGTFSLLNIIDIHGVLNFLEFPALLGFLEFYLYYLCSSYADSSYWHDIAIISYVCKADPYFWCFLRCTLLYLIFLLTNPWANFVTHDISNCIGMKSLKASMSRALDMQSLKACFSRLISLVI